MFWHSLEGSRQCVSNRNKKTAEMKYEQFLVEKASRAMSLVTTATKFLSIIGKMVMTSLTNQLEQFKTE